MTQAQTIAPKVVFVRAPLTRDAGDAIGKGYAKAVGSYLKAGDTFFSAVLTVAKSVGVPLTAAQYDKQVSPRVSASLKEAAAKAKRDPKTYAAYGSRLKTMTLAICNGLAEPLAGESMPEFCTRAASLVASGKTPEGAPIWEAGKKRGAKAKGTEAQPRNPQGGASLASVPTAGEGIGVTALMAAALILAHGNVARARRLCIVSESYSEDFDKWTASILTEKDKAELETLTAPKADEVPATANPVVTAPDASGDTNTALASALINAERKRQRKAA